MATKTIRTYQLTPGATYLVRGKVTFSRISRHTTDAEREKDNATRRSRKLFEIQSNYTSISIDNAQVLCKNSQEPTIEERYAAECLYKSSNNNTNNFSAMNKSRNLPKVGISTGNNTYDEIVLEPGKELAPGLDVTLVMRVFKGDAGNNGVSLDRVLVNEPIRYFSNTSDVDRTLKEFGITFNAMPPQVKPAEKVDANVSTANAAPAPAQTQAPDTTQDTNTNTAPEEQPAAPATNNPFASYNAPQGIQFEPGDRKY